MYSLVLSVAIATGVNSNLLLAVCQKESGLTNVINHSDNGSKSYGPCQVKSIAARQLGLGHIDITKAHNSVLVAAMYLKYSIDKCGNVESGLAHYNTGKCLRTFSKNGYVRDVIQLHNEFVEGENSMRNVICYQNFWEGF